MSSLNENSLNYLEESRGYCRRVEARVSIQRFLYNYRFMLSASARGRQHFKGILPMIKCNAYGHGAVPLARALMESQKGLLGFGVATVPEGLQLRSAGVDVPVYVFSDCVPLSEEVIQVCEGHGLTAILHRESDLQLLSKLARKRKLLNFKFHLKFNTGMNRLGIPWERSRETARLLWAAKLRPQGVCTHLAQASALENTHSVLQWKRFRSVLEAYSSVPFIHAESSDAVLCSGSSPWRQVCNVTRPGIALYGYCNENLKQGEKLKPVMGLYTKVLLQAILQKGESVGYSATFKAKRKTHQSVFAIGYGDGLHRFLSNRSLLINGKKHQVLGRVSMDVTAVEGRFKPGTWVQILGRDQQQGIQMGSSAETNVYEVLTSISPRVRRIYSSGVRK